MIESEQGVAGGSSACQCGIPQHLEGGRDQQQVEIGIIIIVIINIFIVTTIFIRCSGSLESRGSRAESVYEMGDDYSEHDQVQQPLEPQYHDADQHLAWQARLGEEGPSLASELKHLDRAASRPCLVQVMLMLLLVR